MGFNDFGPGGFGGPTEFDGGLNGMADDLWLHDQVMKDAVKDDAEDDAITINLTIKENAVTSAYSKEEKESLYNEAIKELKDYGYPVPLIDINNDEAFDEFLTYVQKNIPDELSMENEKNRLSWESRHKESHLKRDEYCPKHEEERDRIKAEERRKNREKNEKIRAEIAEKNREYAVDNIYQVCQVVLEPDDSGKTISSRAYSYLYKGIDLNIGDKVYIPFGWKNDLKLAKVVGIGRYREENLPVELCMMKAVASKE